jgi:hypothetical protein
VRVPVLYLVPHVMLLFSTDMHRQVPLLDTVHVVVCAGYLYSRLRVILLECHRTVRDVALLGLEIYDSANKICRKYP